MSAKGLAPSQKCPVRPRGKKEHDLFRHWNMDRERVNARFVIFQEMPRKMSHEEATVQKDVYKAGTVA